MKTNTGALIIRFILVSLGILLVDGAQNGFTMFLGALCWFIAGLKYMVIARHHYKKSGLSFTQWLWTVV